ncbi:hypothetical protein R1sor_019252 [Riccia sorocarpa]|uniref:Methyltransferase FkbM domain-containing protein n=1 Tax=Riccia sorocarpa TaxID=122646 RepID=A0ABD3IFM6_9MARC
MVLPRRTGEKLFSPFRFVNIPIILVWMMGIYILLDLSLHLLSVTHYQIQSKESKESNHKESVSSTSVDTKPEKLCDTIEDYIDVHEGQQREPQDPWNQLKWCLPPAECRVKGHLIERLDPLNNYRRGVALGFTTDLDDKTHLEHWFLGTKVDFNKAARRVFIDLGANGFHTSIAWFATRYPVDFTEVYGFETAPNLLRLPAGWDEESNWMDRGIHGWRKIKSRAGFIKHELKLQPEDAVIVKIDIEGAEWPILYDWVKDPEMPKIIDELFVELHYFHPDNNWGSVRQWSRDDATRMLAELRLKGFYAHYWD